MERSIHGGAVFDVTGVSSISSVALSTHELVLLAHVLITQSLPLSLPSDVCTGIWLSSLRFAQWPGCSLAGPRRLAYLS